MVRPLLTLLAAGLLLVGSAPEANRPTAFVGCRIYVDPAPPPLTGGTLITKAGRVASVGSDGAVTIPAAAEIVRCRGETILPGYWNAHVHFTEAQWKDAESANASRLQQQLADMFTRFGFVHVIDTGSDLANTKSLRERIARGEILGPSIRTTGIPFVPPNGTPVYGGGITYPALTRPEQAAQSVKERLAQGADAIKLMTVSLTRSRPFPAMSSEVVARVVAEAHREGSLVLAHPTNRIGLERAISGGVDILLHTTPMTGQWDADLIANLVATRTALVPTLSLWAFEAEREQNPEMAERFGKVAAQQLSAFANAGGTVLFGTDIGYMTAYDPLPELRMMEAAGLSLPQILQSLTIDPARRFSPDERRGSLVEGASADLVVVDGDPAADLSALFRVVRTYRDGTLLFARSPR